MSTYFLAIQNNYTTIQLALFDKNTCCSFAEEDKRLASKCLIPLCKSLLDAHALSLDNLSFIAVNQGPGPFTTLRTVIASVNGVGFATELPLIGVDGLRAFANEYHNPAYSYTVVLLNAFTHDVYYALDCKNRPLETGCKPIKVLLEELRSLIPTEKTIRFIGGGTELHKELIVTWFKQQVIIPDPNPESCSIAQVAKTALQYWDEREHISNQLFPLYLKKIVIKSSQI